MACPTAARGKILGWFLLFKRHVPPKKQKTEGSRIQSGHELRGPQVPVGREMMAAHTAASLALDNQHRWNPPAKNAGEYLWLGSINQKHSEAPS